jgi:glycosyltransferase involved in cell wall biosynthesis
LEVKRSKLIVVLGMHRSGTSAITRGLQVFGVGLGDRLMPAIEGNNDKGFWEDIDLNTLNNEMLSVIDSDWHHLAPITVNDLEILRNKGYFLRAAELLRQKVGSTPNFGFKDPRVAKLLPFWKEVFSHCQFDVNYVLAVRHPLSVVKSLAKRDGFDAEKSYLLWLGHVITGLVESKGNKRVLVDYDLMMQSPEHQLNRIAKCFDLTLDPSELQTYKTAFLDQGLRHSVFEPKDLELDKSCPSLVREVYMALLDVAIDKVRVDGSEIQKEIEKWNAEFDRLATTLTLIDRLQLQKTKVEHVVAERDSQIASLDQAVAEYDGQFAGLNQAVAERDSQIASLNQAVAEYDGQFAGLNQAVAERDSQIASFNQIISERDSQIARLNQAVSEHDGQITGLDRAVAERDSQIARLNRIVSERDSQITRLKQTLVGRDIEIAALRCSTSWRVTKPLRLTSLLLKGKYKELRSFERGTLKQLDSLEEQGNQASTQRHKAPSQGIHELPVGFDRDLYLKLNPDLAKTGVDPIRHYLHHGRYEGRIYALPDIHIQAIRDFNVDLDTILVVSHEASRTGAPVLSLNLVQALVESYNVVALLLSGGPLSGAFQQAGAAVMTVSNLKGNTILSHLVVSQLCERYNFKFALVNSIESRVVLPALGSCFVPTVSLLHEFASYTRPRHAFREALFWSGEVVFSANVTMENAFAEYPDLGERYAHILPQGRCLVPLEEFSEEQLQAERARIRRLIRPKNIAEDSVVVLGAGFVQLRKGIELFIECAARVVRTPQGRRCRFVWIGKGYDPDNDTRYSVYLADQIRRAGLEEHVFFINETIAIEAAYEEADLFLLSSRLDPLPNVAIDAMAYGVPVLCFNKTTGIADFLIDSGLKNQCVAEYLDSIDMAEKILALAGSQDLYEYVAGRCREASIAYFSMKEYVARLETLAQDVCIHTKQEKADTQEILASGLFRRDFSCPPHWHSESVEADVRAYVRAWSSGIDRRKPSPGFDPGIYQEQHGLATDGVDPFADYLRAGQPDGPWNYPVIVASQTMELDLPDNQQVALHLHVYYPELLPEITARLSHNRICPDLFISVANEEARDIVVSELKNYKGKVADIQLVPSRGRDIGPFLTAFGQTILTNYDFVGHIHTKKSVDVKDASVGKSWYRFLLQNLLGDESGAMADSILAKMKGDTSIGMVFPDDPNIVGWNANKAIAETIAARVGIDKLPEHFVFPVGSMFWANTSALAPLMNLKFDWDDYPEEPLPYDGTLLHAIERLFSLSLSVSNLRCAVTNVMGLTR